MESRWVVVRCAQVKGDKTRWFESWLWNALITTFLKSVSIYCFYDITLYITLQEELYCQGTEAAATTNENILGKSNASSISIPFRLFLSEILTCQNPIHPSLHGSFLPVSSYPPSQTNTNIHPHLIDLGITKIHFGVSCLKLLQNIQFLLFICRG